MMRSPPDDPSAVDASPGVAGLPALPPPPFPGGGMVSPTGSVADSVRLRRHQNGGLMLRFGSGAFISNGGASGRSGSGCSG